MLRFLTCGVLRESYRSLTKKERALFWVLAVVCIFSGIALSVLFIANRTIRAPASGGIYREAIIGGPRFINPLLAPANDTDRDLVKLIYAGLVTYDSQGAIVPDLADSYAVSTDTKTYTFTLRENLTWHDGIPLTVDDVVFTIRLMQNVEYQSPLRASWQGVKVEKRDARTVALVLSVPYAPFLAHATVGILPKHIWQDVSPQGFAFSDYNLKPVGAGPFRFADIEREKDGQVTSLTLERNMAYHREPAYLNTVVLKFFESDEDALDAFKNGEVDGVGISGARTSDMQQGGAAYSLSLPRIFAVFFNQNHAKALSYKSVREALDAATDKNRIVQNVYGDEKYAEALHGPLPASVFGYTDDMPQRPTGREAASALLEKNGWKLNDEGVRELREKVKQEQIINRKKVLVDIVATTTLEFSLLTANVPELEKTAQFLKEDWEAIGARVDIEVAGVADIQGERVRPREYDAVLFGQVLGLDPDPYAFWHSSQKRDPGLNLALYHNPKVDKLLEEARQTSSEEERKKKLGEFQKFVADDIPAVFLFSPRYTYYISGQIMGIPTRIIATPAERFGGIAEWYVKTKRVWR